MNDNTRKKLEEIMKTYLHGLMLSSGNYFDPNDMVGKHARERAVNQAFDLIVEQRLDAINSLPRIRNDQYYFVSGKDIDKSLEELKSHHTNSHQGE